jgi:hypothetical protein
MTTKQPSKINKQKKLQNSYQYIFIFNVNIRFLNCTSYIFFIKTLNPDPDLDPGPR